VKPLGVACAELAQWGRPWCSYRTLLGCGHRIKNGRDPDLVRVLAAICPGLVALGAPMHHPAAPTGSPYTQDQMKAASSPNK